MWAGGAALTGDPAALAVLTGERLGIGSGQTLQAADLTGDGVLDIVAQSDLINHGGKQNAGGIVLWVGGPNLANAPAPDAELFAANAAARDFMGKLAAIPSGLKDAGQGVQIIDLDGDGLFEILAGASDADVAGVTDAGAAYLWRPGGLVPAGSDPQEVFSVPGAVPMDYLGGG